MELGDYLSMTPNELRKLVDSVPMRCCKFIASYYPDAIVRRTYLKRIGVVFADDTSFANMGFTVVPNSPDSVNVHIGSHVSIAPNVTFVCDSAANNGVDINRYEYVKERLTKKADIYVSDEAWLGANVTVLPGVTVGRCCVVGAGAVVTRDTDDFGIYVGVPARKVGDVRQWGEDLDGGE